MTQAFRFTLIWLTSSFVAILMALNMLPASHIDGHYIPVSNDSFYHARRILDTAADSRNFFEHDTRIHVPEGSQIAWPWTYDYVLAGIVRIGATLTPAEPMTILAYVPVAATVITIGLVVALCMTLNLSAYATLLTTLCMALSPLTQWLHGVGVVDHHFAELIFVLAALTAGLAWLKDPDSRIKAALTGCALGFAPGFHNGMFILQLPLLIAMGLSWLHGVRMPLNAAKVFVAALLASSLVVLVPSEPFRHWQFEFYLLSWFHLYVAVCSAACAFALASLARTRRNVALLASSLLVAALPLVSKAVLGANFVAGDLDMLKNIVEVKGVLALIETRNLRWVTSLYSGLIFTLPLVVIAGLWLAIRRESSADVRYLGIASAGGLALLAAQFRFHPYGSFALFLPLIAAVDHFSRVHGRHTLAMAGVTILLTASYALPVTSRLFADKEPGNDAYYALTRHSYPVLRDLCRKSPGVVLAGSDAGNYIRYHTDCSVIANNFLLTPQHAAKIRELNERMSMTPDELLASLPRIDYILITLADVAASAPDQEPRAFNTPADFKDAKPALVGALMSAEAESLGPRFQLLMDYRYGDDGIPLARLYQIMPAIQSETGRQ